MGFPHSSSLVQVSRDFEQLSAARTFRTKSVLMIREEPLFDQVGGTTSGLGSATQESYKAPQWDWQGGSWTDSVGHHSCRLARLAALSNPVVGVLSRVIGDTGAQEALPVSFKIHRWRPSGPGALPAFNALSLCSTAPADMTSDNSEDTATPLKIWLIWVIFVRGSVVLLPNALFFSVLGLLLGQGAEWKIHTESQHKEWKIWPKNSLLRRTKICYKIKRLKIEHKWLQTPCIFHIVYLSSMYEQFKHENWKNVTKILTDHQPPSGRAEYYPSICEKKSGILLMLRCHFTPKFPNPRTLLFFSKVQTRCYYP